MIDEILTAAGFAAGKTYTETLFHSPPQRTFVVFHRDTDMDGADDTCEIADISVRLELYALNQPDTAAEQRLETTLKSRGIHYRKYERTWIQSERYFETSYEFNYIEKET